MVKPFNLRKSKNHEKGSANKSNNNYSGSQQAQIIAKWWKSYFSLLEEAFELHVSQNDHWSHSNNEWFNKADHEFLEESFACLEDHYHWKIILMRSICCKEAFFKKLLSQGLMKTEFERRFGLMYNECLKYFLAIADHNIEAIEKIDATGLAAIMKNSLKCLIAYLKCENGDDTAIKSGFFFKKNYQLSEA